jgi:DNA polymerase III subunit chi
MTEIRFYHLLSQPLHQALPALVSKAFENGHRIFIRAPESAHSALSDALWGFKPDSFLPHGYEKDSNPADHPIWISENEDNSNLADLLILTHNMEQDISEEYKLCCDIFDGNNDQDVQAARTRWKLYKNAGHSVTYWQQTQEGGWDKKAG